MNKEEHLTQCEKCTLYQQTFVPWQNPDDPQLPVLFVGEAPGTTEAITKIPFTGGAGKLLWSLLKDAEISKQKCAITNAVACNPPDNRDPTDKECELCRPRLAAEIHECQPTLIVAMGKPAMKELAGVAEPMKFRGEVLPLLPKFNYECDVLCCLHPAFVMRQRQWIDMAVGDFTKIHSLLSGAINPKAFKRPEYIYNPDESTMAELLGEMSKGITAVDIETPSELGILTARVIGIAFYAGGSRAFAMDLNQSDIDTPRWDIMKRFLEDPNAKKCTQNGQFDTGVLGNSNHNVDVKGLVYDTLLAEHTMNSDLPGNLDFLRSRYTNMPAYKPNAKAMKTIEAWTPEQRMSYNCDDVVATWLVMEGQKRMMSKGQRSVLETIEIPLIDVCNYMEKVGIKVDVPVLAVLNMRIQPRLEKMQKEIFDPLGLNPNSPVQLKKYFGVEGTGEDILKQYIRRRHKEAKLMKSVLDYRGLAKIVSTYLVGVHDKLREGRIHAHPKIEGTGTGRLSYQKPNLQNVPINLRVIYIPDDEDHCLVDADYSQLELRTIALLAPEPIMLAEFAEGKRIHGVIGKEVYKKEWDDLTTLEKQNSKGIVFGTAYGLSARTLAIKYGVPIIEAERWQQVCVKKYPGILNYLRKQEHIFSETHKCSTPFGRIRFLQTVTQAYNTPVQSTASDVVLKYGIVDSFRKGFDLRITVHDSIVPQMEKKNLKEQCVEFKKIMEQPVPELNNYQFPTKIKAGDNWRDVKEVNLE